MSSEASRRPGPSESSDSQAPHAAASSHRLQGELEVRWKAGWRLELPSGLAPAGGWPVVVALHGAYEDAERMEERLSPWPELGPVAKLCLDGPLPAVVADEEGRRRGRLWYLYVNRGDQFVDALRQAAAFVEEALEQAAQLADLNFERRLLLGYSMGGYLAGWIALSAPRRWRGLVVVGARVKQEALQREMVKAKDFPCLFVHGERDRVVPLSGQRKAAGALLSAGVAVTLQTHPAGHRFPQDHLPLIAEFVAECLSS